LKDSSQLLALGTKIKMALRDVWKDPSTDVFDIGYERGLACFTSMSENMSMHYRSQEEVVRIDRLAEEVGIIQSLRNSFQPILNIILAALDAPPIFMRTKALRALGQIVTSDATILSMVST
jgi:cohesin loading factor subunit SCC2